jgi:hypothetical protein
LSLDIFTKRGVSEAVRRDRGYVPYAKGDRETVLREDDRLGEFDGWLRACLQTSGWVIPKVAPMPDHPHFGWRPYTQLRPDRPVMARAFGHDHDGMLHRHRDDPKLQKRRGGNRGRCYCGVVHLSEPMRTAPDWNADPDPFETFEEWTERRKAVKRGWYQRPIADRAEHEASVCEWAKVPKETKLPVLILDERERDGAREVLVPTGHLHPDSGDLIVPLDRPHTHLDWAKYAFVKGHGKAQRLNTHPWMLKSDYATPDGLFVIVAEGTLKLDSLVSAGWPGIEAGSVTLWDATWHERPSWNVKTAKSPEAIDRALELRRERELEEFAARYLQGVPTAVICDSDWAENWMVRAQVDRIVEVLAACDVPAVGCAPEPGDELGWKCPLTGHPKRAKAGLDDALAGLPEDERHDGLLDIIIVREDGKDDPPSLVEAVAAASRDPRTDETYSRVLRDVGRRATDSGVVPLRRQQVAKAVRRHPNTVDEAMDRLVGADVGIKKIADSSKHFIDGEWKSSPPRYTLPPELRTEPRRRSLREWLADTS